MLSGNKFRDLLLYLSFIVMRCIPGELLYVFPTKGVLIGKKLPDYATTGDIASYAGLAKIDSSHKI